jgi:hypothetical protein
MDTDRELLEWAARAVGLEMQEDGNGALYVSEGNGPTFFWAPLTDDGDAFRLAVKLKLHVDPHQEVSGVTVWAFDGTGAHDFEENQTDASAATRRAIVRAAAAIGRSAHPPKGA